MDLSRDACEARLRASMLDITTNPDRWEQTCWVANWGINFGDRPDPSALGEWPCGTVACLAGHAAALAGLTEYTPGDGYRVSAEGRELIDRAGVDSVSDFGALGRVLFGLDVEAALWLFESTNTLTQLWDIVGKITDGRVTLPDDLITQVLQVDAERQTDH